jgi:hypothetical protein
MTDYGSLLVRATDLAVDLVARCQIADPDESRGLYRPARQILHDLQRHAARFTAAQRVGEGNVLAAGNRTLLRLILMNMMLLEALSARPAEEHLPASALPTSDAERIAQLLAAVGMFTEDMYRWQDFGVPQPYVHEAAKASLYLGPLAEAFAAAMQGNHVAADEARRLFEQFVSAADAGTVMPPPEELTGGIP